MRARRSAAGSFAGAAALARALAWRAGASSRLAVLFAAWVAARCCASGSAARGGAAAGAALAAGEGAAAGISTGRVPAAGARSFGGSTHGAAPWAHALALASTKHDAVRARQPLSRAIAAASCADTERARRSSGSDRCRRDESSVRVRRSRSVIGGGPGGHEPRRQCRRSGGCGGLAKGMPRRMPNSSATCST